MPDSAAIYVGVGVQKNVRILHDFRTPSSRSKVGDFGSSTLWAHCWTFFSCAIRAEPVGWSVDVEGPISGDFLLKLGLCTVSTVLLVCASWAFEEERKILVLSAVLICLPVRYHELGCPGKLPSGWVMPRFRQCSLEGTWRRGKKNGMNLRCAGTVKWSACVESYCRCLWNHLCTVWHTRTVHLWLASTFSLLSLPQVSEYWEGNAANRIVTWLILPVVICLSQRLSHACLSISNCTVKLRMAHYISYSLFDSPLLLGYP